MTAVEKMAALGFAGAEVRTMGTDQDQGSGPPGARTARVYFPAQSAAPLALCGGRRGLSAGVLFTEREMLADPTATAESLAEDGAKSCLALLPHEATDELG